MCSYQANSRDQVDWLLARGWCVHHLLHLNRTCESTYLYSYLTTFDRSGTRNVDHSACIKESQCIALNVDPCNYETRHTQPGCACQLIPVPYRQLAKIISDREIPLVSIEESTDLGDSTTADLVLKLHTRQTEHCYTALSHVWADGLGNPSQNSLPSCQLKWLRQRLKPAQGNHSVRLFCAIILDADGASHFSGWTHSAYPSGAKMLTSERSPLTLWLQSTQVLVESSSSTQNF